MCRNRRLLSVVCGLRSHLFISLREDPCGELMAHKYAMTINSARLSRQLAERSAYVIVGANRGHLAIFFVVRGLCGRFSEKTKFKRICGIPFPNTRSQTCLGNRRALQLPRQIVLVPHSGPRRYFPSSRALQRAPSHPPPMGATKNILDDMSSSGRA